MVHLLWWKKTQPVLVEEDAVAETKLLFVRLIAKGRKVIVCLRRQNGHLSIALVAWVTVVADLVSSSVLEDVIRVDRVTELTLIVPQSAGTDERMAYGDIQSANCLLSHADVADFKIGAVAALTCEHPLVIGGKTGGITDALQRPQNMLVCEGTICIMMDA
jgi:hypothetical protein